MAIYRNPFLIRTAEQAESEDQFLTLFGLDVLDILPEEGSWNRFLPIQLAPGAGKSTLLRLFTPTILSAIVAGSRREELRKLALKLRELDAIGADEVRLLGVLVNCKEDYSRLVDIELPEGTRNRLFWTLLHARLVLLVLRATLQLVKRSYPSDIDLISFQPRPDVIGRRPHSRIYSGRELFEAARAVEEQIIAALSSFRAVQVLSQPPDSVGDVFELLNTHSIYFNQQQVAAHTLLMFDDAHLLDDTQRTLLTTELRRHDNSAFASWMAMRLRALKAPEVVLEEVRNNRESFSPVQFTDWNQNKVGNWLLDIGDRRARRAELEVASFSACLAESLATEIDDGRLRQVALNERNLAHEAAKPFRDFYAEWLRQAESGN